MFNVVNGDKEAVDALLTHPDVKAVSFVGSTPIARYIYATGTANGKRVQALGGAKNHVIIMPDADIDMAVGRADGRGLRLGRRALHGDLGRGPGRRGDRERADREAGAEDRGAEGRAGVPTASSDMGPLVTAQHLAKVKGYIDQGVKEGAKLVVDGRGFKAPQGYENGYFVGGSLFDGVTTGHDDLEGGDLRPGAVGRPREELRRGGRDGRRSTSTATAWRSSPATATRRGPSRTTSRSGMVGVNVPIPVPMAFHSFGGWKASLFGDHHMHGPEGVRFYTRLKTITTRWPTGMRAEAEFVMPTMG